MHDNFEKIVFAVGWPRKHHLQCFDTKGHIFFNKFKIVKKNFNCYIIEIMVAHLRIIWSMECMAVLAMLIFSSPASARYLESSTELFEDHQLKMVHVVSFYFFYLYT